MKKPAKRFDTRILVSLLLCGVLVMSGFQGFGKNWTATQKEVWDSQQAYFEHWRKGDFDGVLAMCHEDYAAWSYDQTNPVERRKHISDIVFYARISSFVLRPVDIKVFGNVAIVYFARKITLQNGKVYSDYAMSDQGGVACGALKCQKSNRQGLQFRHRLSHDSQLTGIT